MRRNARKVPLSIFLTPQADLGPLTESIATATVVDVDEQRMSRSDCTNAHADVDFRVSHIT